MALHFTAGELAGRRAALQRSLRQAGLDGLLMFRQESMYYLTGYDTFGYVYFQCLYFGAAGDLFLLTRKPDLLQAQLTSDIGEIHIWVDADAADPAAELKRLLQARKLQGKKLGVEYDAYGLTAQNGKRLEAALDGFCKLADASLLVTRLRLVKSPAELAYVRRAAALADDALDEAHRLVKMLWRRAAVGSDILWVVQYPQRRIRCANLSIRAEPRPPLISIARWRQCWN
jgi:Xaa-Pro dipeptidase